jgi:hypothetical protein
MLPGTKTMALAETNMARKVVMHWVAENFYRLESSGGYYALPKRGDKQFRRSQKANPGSGCGEYFMQNPLDLPGVRPDDTVRHEDTSRTSKD